MADELHFFLVYIILFRSYAIAPLRRFQFFRPCLIKERKVLLRRQMEPQTHLVHYGPNTIGLTQACLPEGNVRFKAATLRYISVLLEHTSTSIPCHR